MVKFKLLKNNNLNKGRSKNMNMPNNPIILLSYINTQLRDNYANLDDLCLSLDCSKSEIIYMLSKINYEYNESLNQFKLCD